MVTSSANITLLGLSKHSIQASVQRPVTSLITLPNVVLFAPLIAFCCFSRGYSKSLDCVDNNLMTNTQSIRTFALRHATLIKLAQLIFINRRPVCGRFFLSPFWCASCFCRNRHGKTCFFTFHFWIIRYSLDFATTPMTGEEVHGSCFIFHFRSYIG